MWQQHIGMYRSWLWWQVTCFGGGEAEAGGRSKGGGGVKGGGS